MGNAVLRQETCRWGRGKGVRDGESAGLLWWVQTTGVGAIDAEWFDDQEHLIAAVMLISRLLGACSWGVL